MIQGVIILVGGFIFVCALVIFWYIIDEVRDRWRSMREMERLEMEIDAENINVERRAHYQALLDSAAIDGRESDEASSLASSHGQIAPLASRGESPP